MPQRPHKFTDSSLHWALIKISRGCSLWSRLSKFKRKSRTHQIPSSWPHLLIVRQLEQQLALPNSKWLITPNMSATACLIHLSRYYEDNEKVSHVWLVGLEFISTHFCRFWASFEQQLVQWNSKRLCGTIVCATPKSHGWSSLLDPIVKDKQVVSGWFGWLEQLGLSRLVLIPSRPGFGSNLHNSTPSTIVSYLQI